MDDARDWLVDLRNRLGEKGFIDALWAMRVKEDKPVREAHARGWRWNQAKILPFPVRKNHG